MLRRQSLDRKCHVKDSSHIQKHTNISVIYKNIGRIKRFDDKVISPYTTFSCVIDIVFQDMNMTNDIINCIDTIISTKDTIDNGIVVGLNTRPALKRREKVAIVKLLFIIYKIFIYKIVIMSILNKDDHMTRLCIDYINLLLDNILS